MEVTALTKARIMQYLNEGKRFDKRSLLEYRPFELELGISKNAEGSARVKLGETEVVAGVKLDIGEPFTDTPDQGMLVVTAELLPLASEKFEPGPPRVEAIELARIVDRAIRESEFVELKKLTIKKGEKVWSLFVDIYPLNDAGNLIDASVMAAVAALADAVFPETKDKEKVNFGEFTTKKLPLSDSMPLTLTFHKLGKNFILDPGIEEEESSEARLTLALSQEKKVLNINALQKGGEAPLSVAEVEKLLDLASEEWKKLCRLFEEELKKAIQARPKREGK